MQAGMVDYARSRSYRFRAEPEPPGSTPLISGGLGREVHTALSLERDGRSIWLAHISSTHAPAGRSEHTVALVPRAVRDARFCGIYVEHKLDLAARASRGLESAAGDELLPLEIDVALNARYDVAATARGSTGALEELFSPEFVQHHLRWPEPVGWETHETDLCAHLNGHRADDAGLDVLLDASVQVAERLEEMCERRAPRNRQSSEERLSRGATPAEGVTERILASAARLMPGEEILAAAFFRRMRMGIGVARIPSSCLVVVTDLHVHLCRCGGTGADLAVTEIALTGSRATTVAGLELGPVEGATVGVLKLGLASGRKVRLKTAWHEGGPAHRVAQLLGAG